MSDENPRPKPVRQFPRDIDFGVEPSDVIRVPPVPQRVVPSDEVPSPPPPKKK
jgi:hypothetical protein